MTSPDGVATEKKSSGVMTKAKTVLTTILLMALTGAVGYGAGRLQTRSQVKTAQTASTDQIAALEEKVSAAEATAAAAEARSQLNEVRSLLLQSVDELNDRNFGTSNTHLRQASDMLNEVTQSKDDKALTALKEELAAEEVNFAVNPVEERRKLINFAEQITNLLPE